MTSFEQRSANRKNATRSTGPTSPEGKDVSRRNALRHGCRAKALLLDTEDAGLFESFRDALIEELAPEGVLEAQFAEQMVNLIWRSRRIAVFEAAVLSWMRHWSGEYYDVCGYHKGWNGSHERVQVFHKGLVSRDKKRSPEKHEQLLLGRLLHEEMNHNLMAKLSRYEAHLLAQLRRAHTDLLAHQARRTQHCPQAENQAETTCQLEPARAANGTADIDLHYGTNTPRRSHLGEQRITDPQVPHRPQVRQI